MTDVVLPQRGTPLFLASGSPRRAELLTQVGARFTRLPAPGVDETPFPDEPAEQYVIRLARAKAGAGEGLRASPGAVLGADTAVVLEERILGKPVDDEDALAMIDALCGREHRVLSGVCVLYQGEARTAMSTTRVRFRELTAAQRRAYVAHGEGRDKAGAYGIQGLGAALVASLAGSYSGVVGLPLEQTLPLLEWAGVPYGISVPAE
ncbi:Maf family protein [Alloalcanivorax xenomutans]|jgi:septum formation protein|uniref:Maf family protein n=1 Tax=Alloalcanivorax xenomutans TaxID=1094342 RepID=UPI000E238B50|nr:Maf family nucleotide pyrophosphatase [Alloalcanivorax xenomutans]WOA30631.1 Maf family protein [Alloalcanivorax xenomutans]